MHQHYVGLDVHSKQSVFAIADAAGRWVAEGEVPTTPAGLTALRERHALAPQTPVALETGTSAFFVARQLSALGLAPVVVDAHEVRVKAHRPTQKSDRRDARELCEGLRRGIYRVIVHVPSAQVARLRDTLSRRRHFVRVQTAEINAAKRLLRAAGLGQTRCNLRTESGWAALLETLDPSSDLHTYLEQHRALWRCAGEQLRALDHAPRVAPAPVRGRPAAPPNDPRRGAHRRRDGGGGLRRCAALSRCEARGELRRLDPVHPSIGGARCARADHQTRVR